MQRRNGAGKLRPVGLAPTGRTGRRQSSRPSPTQWDPGFYQGGARVDGWEGGENVLRSARWRAGEGTPVFRPAPRPAGPRSAYRQPRKSARTAWNAGLRPASRPDRAANGTNRKQRDGPYCDACFNRKGGAGVGDPATRRYAVPPACGGRCRPEVGVPCPGRASGNPALRRSLRFAQRCRSEGPHRENWPAFPAPLDRASYSSLATCFSYAAADSMVPATDAGSSSRSRMSQPSV